jgi:hypothetical protein
MNLAENPPMPIHGIGGFSIRRVLMDLDFGQSGCNKRRKVVEDIKL